MSTQRTQGIIKLNMTTGYFKKQSVNMFKTTDNCNGYVLVVWRSLFKKLSFYHFRNELDGCEKKQHFSVRHLYKNAKTVTKAVCDKWFKVFLEIFRQNVQLSRKK
jgi:hypothetical protein